MCITNFNKSHQIYFIDIYIKKNNGDAKMIKSHQEFVSNSKFLGQPDKPNLPGPVPQRGVNEGLGSDEEVRGKRRALEYCGSPEGNLKGEEGLEFSLYI